MATCVIWKSWIVATGWSKQSEQRNLTQHNTITVQMSAAFALSLKNSRLERERTI